jgi:hypothetical protein
MLIVLMGLIKLPIAALMLWIPFRDDTALNATEPPGQSDDDGGSRALPAGPLDPHPRRPPFPRSPRRGPHGAPPPPSPRRIRKAARVPHRIGVSH